MKPTNKDKENKDSIKMKEYLISLFILNSTKLLDMSNEVQSFKMYLDKHLLNELFDYDIVLNKKELKKVLYNLLEEYL